MMPLSVLTGGRQFINLFNNCDVEDCEPWHQFFTHFSAFLASDHMAIRTFTHAAQVLQKALEFDIRANFKHI